MKLVEVAGSFSLMFECGDLPADVAVFAAEHEPNGYFWEGVVRYLADGLLSQVELDPEAAGGTSICFKDPDGVRLELLADPFGEMYGTKVL